MASDNFAGWRSALPAAASGLVAMFALSCDEPPRPEKTSSRAEKRAEQLRKRVDEFSEKTAEVVRSHRPDGGIEFDGPDTTD